MAKKCRQIVLGRTAEGKQIRKRVYGSTDSEINRKVAKLMSESAEHPSDILFKNYAEKWFKTYKSGREAKTRQMYQAVLKKTANIDYMRLKDIIQTDLQQILTDNKESPRLCQQIRLTFRQIWKTAIEDGIIVKDVTKHLEVPVYAPIEGRALTDKEKKAIKKAKLSPMDRMYVSILFYFGLRPGEAVALQRGDFDLKKGILTVRRAVAFDGNRPYIKNTKTNTIRNLPIPSEFAPILRFYHEGDSLYLLNSKGHIMSKTSVRCMWDRCKREINKQLGGNEKMDMTNGLRPYTFRHNYCTTCYYSGITIKKCQSLMGHSSAQMVMRVYAHLDDDKEATKVLKAMTMQTPKSAVQLNRLQKAH